MFLNSYLICKLNTDLHTKTFGLEHKNGFELYRVVCQLVDAIPENAAFHLNNELLNLTKQYGSKVVDLRTLYGFRLLLKRKVAEYKKVIGNNPSEENSYAILWNVMDPDSKTKAMAANLAGRTYKELYDHIDQRHRIMFGTLDYKAEKKDDPMGLALLGYPEPAAVHVPPGYEPASAPPAHPGPDVEQRGMFDQHLDAMGGKGGKGKGKGDGKCHTCGGDGHFSRECPSTAPVGPQSVECLGCNGRGHIRAQCPTANPHLKGKGKGAGGKGWDSGKGWGGKPGGKGWGGKGKGGKGYGWGQGQRKRIR